MANRKASAPDPAAAALAERFQRGESAALAEVAQKFQNLVFRLAFKLSGGGAPAEDITQEVFVKLFEKHASFRGESELSTWIYRITVNVAKNYLHRQRGIFGMLANSDSAPEPLSNRPDPEAEALSGEFEQAFRRALAKLSEKNREAFVLKHLEGLSYEEMEQILGVSSDKLKMRVHRARLALGEELKGYL